ncbi:hypothetical protein HJFPF1_00667 [Paramyrothecium foliicola]|nr:hypothetical protein HJFPF1_00667 [Paramyrothecium foliicola]
MAPIPESLPAGEYILLPTTLPLPWTDDGLIALTAWTKVFLVRFVTNLTILLVLIGILAAIVYLVVGIQRRISRLVRNWLWTTRSRRRRLSGMTDEERSAKENSAKWLLAQGAAADSSRENNCYRDHDVRPNGPTSHGLSLTGHSCLSPPTGVRLLHQRWSWKGRQDAQLRMRRLQQVSGTESIS